MPTNHSVWRTLIFRTRTFLLAAALSTLFAATQSNAADLAAGEQAAAICITCHAADGSALLPEYPGIAGQGAKYLSDQMRMIRSGERNIALMAGLLDDTDDETIENIAAWYASLTPRQGQAQEAGLELGERIYRAGIAAKSVSACSACHSPNGAGNALAGFPSLRGLSRPYLVAQLKAYRENRRVSHERFGGMMQGVAHQLTDSEIEAVANYISGIY